jgi:hypothetical protein
MTLFRGRNGERLRSSEGSVNRRSEEILAFQELAHRAPLLHTQNECTNDYRNEQQSADDNGHHVQGSEPLVPIMLRNQ